MTKYRSFFQISIMTLFIFSCKGRKNDIDLSKTNSVIKSVDSTSLRITFSENKESKQLLFDSLLFGSNCDVAIKTIQGRSALEIKTDKEFSDAFIDIKASLGHPIDFTSYKYISMDILIPDDSWIAALKLNFKDSLGNFGGCPEVANNFYGHYNQWFSIVTNLQQLTPHFKNWEGTDNPLHKVSYLSLNPYNANQADSSLIYINNIMLSNDVPQKSYIPARIEKMDSIPNIPFEINFDNKALLKKLMAYRSFESSYQAMSKNIAGNETMAIRLKGSDKNKHIAFLPILEKITGHPVDFTQVKYIYFSYYITKESDDFDGIWLYLTSEHWQDILVDKNFIKDYVKGSWQKVRIPVNELQFIRERGDQLVLSNVYELRVELNYFPDKKNIEMWIDNFGWE